MSKKVLTGFFLAVMVLAAMTFSAPKQASAEGLYFAVINQSGSTIYAAYASPAGSGYWTGDLMTNDILFPFESGTIVFDDGLRGCYYDLKFETDRGNALLYGVNLCVVDYVTIY